jgi:3-mercaptopyruvate sulfurtransferase SseA
MKIKFIASLLIVINLFIFTGNSLADDKTAQQFIDEATAQVQSVSIHDVKKMMDAEEDIIILDIRDKEEFVKGHIPGAIHISRGLLEFMVTDKIPDKDARIVVY